MKSRNTMEEYSKEQLELDSLKMKVNYWRLEKKT